MSRFKDGRFTVYTTADGLVNDFVANVHKATDGSIWIATDGGLSRFKDGRFTNYTVKDGLSHDALRALYTDTDGSLWIGTNRGGLNRFADGRFQHRDDRRLRRREEISVDLSRPRRRAVGRLLRRPVQDQARQAERFTIADGLSSNKVHFISQEARGVMWLGTSNGLVRYEHGTVHRL